MNIDKDSTTITVDDDTFHFVECGTIKQFGPGVIPVDIEIGTVFKITTGDGRVAYGKIDRIELEDQE